MWWAEPDFITTINKYYVPNDPFFASHQWHLHNTGQFDANPGADIKAASAWDIEQGNSGITIAIHDDGVQNHPDLSIADGGMNYNNDPAYAYLLKRPIPTPFKKRSSISILKNIK